MLRSIGLAIVVVMATVGPASATAGARSVAPKTNHLSRPHVTLWTDRGVPYHRGDRVRLNVSLDQDAYLTVLWVNTDGRFRILFPIDPWRDNYGHGGRAFEVTGRSGEEAFLVEDDPGLGYLFVVAAPDPFDYDAFVSGDRWNYGPLAGGWIRTDPYAALTGLAARIAAGSDYDYDMISYAVEDDFEYPRFICYDCHSYRGYAEWNPYAAWCTRFRVVIYDDPVYYPYRYAASRNVVIARPTRLAPQFVFKDSDGQSAYVSRVPASARRSSAPGAFLPDRGSADLGGRGVVPAPGRVGQRSAPWSRTPGTPAPPGRPAPKGPGSDLAPVDPAQSERRPSPPRESAATGAHRRDPPPGSSDRARPAVQTPSPQSAPRVGDTKREPRKEPPKSTGEPRLRRRIPG